MNTSTLYIVGSGPGDPELLSIKAYKAIQQADLILYDNLVNQEILKIASLRCEMIYVGKKPYQKTTTQEQIHDLIAHHSSYKERIVRLKGGDPFIFGRGFEEMIFAQHIGMETQYIPGISSMQTVGLQNIPLTHRGISDSFWVITGTKEDGSLSKDINLAMKSEATVIIYMGMKKLSLISELYERAGLGNMPAAIIQNGSMENQKQVICNAEELYTASETNQLTNPAIIIIGRVVNVSQQLINQLKPTKIERQKNTLYVA